MPMRRLSAAVSPLLSLVEWIFSPLAPGVDLFLGLAAGFWGGMMVGRPGVFDTGNFVGMQWAPDAAWIVFVVGLFTIHMLGLLRPTWWQMRSAACLLSAWYWFLIAISLTRPGLTTGTWTYSLIGLVGLTAAIYVSGRGARRG